MLAAVFALVPSSSHANKQVRLADDADKMDESIEKLRRDLPKDSPKAQASFNKLVENVEELKRRQPQQDEAENIKAKSPLVSRIYSSSFTVACI